jgi:hypothetical protein
VVRGFFEVHLGRIRELLIEAVPVFERWHWSMSDVDEMDFEEWFDIADVVEALNKRDEKARNGR